MSTDCAGVYAEIYERYYGVRATLVLPARFSANGEKRGANFYGYVAFVNPLTPNDSHLEVGVSRCATHGSWTLFVWSPLPRIKSGIRREVEIELLPGKAYEFDLRFARHDHTRFELLINGLVIWRDAFPKPISKSTYDDGGVSALLGIGAGSDCGAISFDQMRWCGAFGAIDPLCQTWKPFANMSAEKTLARSPSGS